MNIQRLHRRIILPLLVLGLLVMASTLHAAERTPAQNNIYNYLELLRSDFNSAKVDIINQIMKLTAADAEKFWPVYREYEKALADQSVNRAEFIAEFVKAHESKSLDNRQAQDMAKRWFKLQRTRLDLLEKYHKKIEKTLSPVHAAQFLQIENQLMLFIDVTIAGEMPLVGKS